MIDIGERCVLDNVSNEQEPPYGSQSKSNIPNMEFAEVTKIDIKFDCDDSVCI